MSTTPIVFPLFDAMPLAKAISISLGYDIGTINFHEFPDEEISTNISLPIQNKEVIFIANLDRPNTKLTPLLFAAATARELGAKKIGLIAPYLPYMRQDKQFHSGDGVTSVYFAKLISNYFNGLITIDPHLHRWHSLNQIYSIPTTALHATNPIARWIKSHISNAVLIGPDAESSQWVSAIAKIANLPFLILKKIRKGDNLVEVSIPEIEHYKNHTPILIDDIISTAATMIQTTQHLKTLGMKPPICIAVHAIFTGNAYKNLQATGVEKIITCNTVQHESNGVDVTDILIQKIGGIFIS